MKQQVKRARLNSAITLILVSIGLAASLASANPDAIEDSTLSFKEMFADLESANQVNSINSKEWTPVEDTFEPSLASGISNETMLAPVVRIERTPSTTAALNPVTDLVTDFPTGAVQSPAAN